jgi:hypothetical protein
MNFDVYCDESHPDAFTSHNPRGDYLVIGSLWLPTADRAKHKAALHALREQHKIGPEFKWSKLSRSRLPFYAAVVEWFFAQGDAVRFRAIAVDRRKLDLLKFHENDAELGFYKFYYQLLQTWILDYNRYALFCDWKSNRKADRLRVLKQCLSRSNLSAEVAELQPVPSEESVLIQCVDVLTGAVAARINRTLRPGSTKSALVETLERYLGHVIGHTSKGEQKFNVFNINPGGGW